VQQEPESRGGQCGDPSQGEGAETGGSGVEENRAGGECVEETRVRGSAWSRRGSSPPDLAAEVARRWVRTGTGE
jgi:hypothetical protein